VIGSSNLRDIRTYCQEKQITYLTTMDFLWYAWRKHLMTTDEVKTFMNEVRSKGSKLPEVDIEKYVCETVL
jgi:undecaprenyl pyrophosphate synthase